MLCFLLFQWWWTLDGAHSCKCQWHSAGIFTKSLLHKSAPTDASFDPSVAAPGSCPEVSQHPPLCWRLPSDFLVSPAGTQPNPLWVLQLTWLTAWQLPGGFPAHPPQLAPMLFGKKKITANHSWPTVLQLPSWNHQCSRGRFLACQPKLVVFNPPALAHWLCTSSDQAQFNKCMCWNPTHSNKIWISSLGRIFPFNAYVFLGYYLSALDDSLEFSSIHFQQSIPWK